MSSAVKILILMIILSGCSTTPEDCLLGSLFCEAKDQEVETEYTDNQTRIDVQQRPIPQRQLFLDY